MSDYIPDNSAEFRAWLKNFLDFANANLAALGLVAADTAPLAAAATTFNTDLDEHIAAQAAAKGKRESKDAQVVGVRLFVNCWTGSEHYRDSLSHPALPRSVL